MRDLVELAGGQEGEFLQEFLPVLVGAEGVVHRENMIRQTPDQSEPMDPVERPPEEIASAAIPVWHYHLLLGEREMKAFWHAHGRWLLVLALLAVLPYLPLFSHPLLQDDYPNIEQARQYGPVSNWLSMVSDPVFRYRATSWLLTYWIDRYVGLIPLAFYAVSIGLHVANTWLVYALGTWKAIGWQISAAAAGFFAVAEGHQEAIMWYSASNELLLFFFAALTLLLWICFVQDPKQFYWYPASVCCFVLALLSKESAVILVPLLGLPLLSSPIQYRRLLLLLPYAALAAGDVWLIFASQTQSFRFSDGSFSLHAPFWITLPMSLARLLWPWGLLALVAVLLCRAKDQQQRVVISTLWMAIALVPYSFLTYMTHVPSRQTYLASLGLAWIVGAGFLALRTAAGPARRLAVMALVLVVIFTNVGYLWTRKRSQFLERAAPTEALVSVAQKTEGRVYVRCYPDARIVAEAAIRLRTGKPASILIWPGEPSAYDEDATEFCWKNPS